MLLLVEDELAVEPCGGAPADVNERAFDVCPGLAIGDGSGENDGAPLPTPAVLSGFGRDEDAVDGGSAEAVLDEDADVAEDEDEDDAVCAAAEVAAVAEEDTEAEFVAFVGASSFLRKSMAAEVAVLLAEAALLCCTAAAVAAADWACCSCNCSALRCWLSIDTAMA